MNQRTKTPAVCKQCGTTFYPFPASTGKFCSNACKFQAKRKTVLAACHGCGAVFDQKLRRWRGKYCTNECYQQTKRDVPIMDRLLKHITKTDYCWTWNGNISNMGYGRYMVAGKSWLVHRLMYHLTTGEDIANIIVRHYECDNPPCCNPAHLRPGTRRDNSMDAVRHERHAHGETTYAKLNESDARAIWHDRRTHDVIAAEYGIARRTVGHIKNGTTWGHLGLGRNTFRNPTRPLTRPRPDHLS